VKRQLIPGLRPRIDRDLVEKALGGPGAIPNTLEPDFQRLRHQVEDASDPQGALALSAITHKSDNTITLELNISLQGLGLFTLLELCESVAAFVVTLGPGPEQLIAKAQEEGRLKDLALLDAIASEAVESLAEQAQDFIARLAQQEGRGITRRFSPGYCDFAIEQQAVLETLVPFAACGVRLNRASLMLPEKSISAVIGLGPAGSYGSSLSRPPPCKTCSKRRDCPGATDD
jgi:hypothetical protein